MPIFRAQIQRMYEGVNWDELDIDFRRAVATLRFVPCMETINEAKHAAVTRAGKKVTHIGPIMHSLSNRMPLARKRLSRDEDGSVFNHFVEAFSKARLLGDAAAKLGISAHPMLAGLNRNKSSKLQKPLASIIYRTHLEGQFIDLGHVKKKHLKRKIDETKETTKLLGQESGGPHQEVQKQAVTFNSLKHAAILDHFRWVADRVYFCSLPCSSSLHMQGVSSLFNEAPTLRQPPPASRVMSGMELDLEFDEGMPSSAAGEGEKVFFSVLKTDPARAKDVAFELGARMKLQSAAVAVEVHTSEMLDHGRYLIDRTRSRSQEPSDAIAFLTQMAQVDDVEDLERSLLSWSLDPQVVYVVPGTTNSQAMQKFLARLIESGGQRRNTRCVVRGWAAALPRPAQCIFFIVNQVGSMASSNGSEWRLAMMRLQWEIYYETIQLRFTI